MNETPQVVPKITLVIFMAGNGLDLGLRLRVKGLHE